MAITQAGSTLDLAGFGTANTGTVSSTITVPADAEIVVVFVTGISFNNGHFSGGTMTFTKGGVDTTMSGTVGEGDAAVADRWQGAMFYLVQPDTGSNKSLKFDWAGSATLDDGGTRCTVTFWKGIDTASPVRDSGGGQAASFPISTSSLTAASGDLIVACIGGYCNGGEGTIASWTNATTLSNITAGDGNVDCTWATHSPTGDTTVTASTATNMTDGALMALVLKPAGAGGGNAPRAMGNRREQGMS